MPDTDTTTPDAPTTDAPAPADPPATEPPATDRLPDDHPLVKALAAQKAELKKLRQEAKEREDAEKDDLTRAIDDAAAEKERADNAEAEVARLRAAVKHGLTDDDLDLLGGGTAEEIEARAERLAARIGTAGKERRNPTPTLGLPEGEHRVDVDELVDSIPSTA